MDADLPAVHELYQRDPNRFITCIMNLQVYGLQSSLLRAYGSFTPQGDLTGLLLRYSNICLAADADGMAGAAFAQVIDEESGLAGIRGAIETVKAISVCLHRYQLSSMEVSTFMRLDEPVRLPENTFTQVRAVTTDDLDLVTDLYSRAGAMYRSRMNVQNMLSKVPHSPFFAAETQQDGERLLVSGALLNIISTEGGLIGGVYTRPEFRGRGCAARCTAAVAHALQSQQRLPCLFYENPVAGRVYSRLGFREVAFWAVLYLHQQ